MQAVRLSRWRSLHFHANSDSGACSLGQDRGHPASRRTPAAIHRAMSFPSFRAIHADVLKGMISYRIGFSECEHGPASNRQHARKRFFTESRRACQGQNSDQMADRFGGGFGPEMARKFSLVHSVTPGPPPSSWSQEVPMRRLIAAIFASARRVGTVGSRPPFHPPQPRRT